MGNVALCAPSIISNGVVKVLPFNGGSLQVYTKPVKAGEVMVERTPGEFVFVCEWSSLKVGQRIQGLSAEEELERGQLYFLLPMELLYSVLTHDELSSLTRKATKALKHGGSSGSGSSSSSTSQQGNNFGKIFPVLTELCIFPSSEPKTSDDDDDDDDDDDECGSSSGRRLISKQRSWKPALETIAETPSRHI